MANKRSRPHVEPEPLGRPSKFTPERCDKILSAIGAGIPYELAAEANGICEDTLYEWIKLGRQDIRDHKDTTHSRFSETLKNVELSKMRHHLEEIQDKPERWQADAWILERRWWKHFSPNAAVVEFNKRLSRMEDDDKDHSDGKVEGGTKK
jgi:hypothetical protein